MESPESWFHRRATDYVEAQILFHLNQAGVFGLLSDGGSYSAARIADELNLEVGPTDALLDYVFGVDDLLSRGPNGDYSLSDFGRKVVDRFSGPKGEAEKKAINFFDVRVGAYGPVWGSLDRLLSGEGRYGVDVHRKGEYAEDGVSKLAMNFWPILAEHVEEAAPKSLLEVGLTTGLIERLGESYPGLTLYGLDRSESSIERSSERAEARGLEGIRWIRGDFFDVGAWSGRLGEEGPGTIYSLHFHELMARGEASFVEALRALKAAFPRWSLLAFEQPLLDPAEREKTPETLWLYSQSNVLIHHLIGNGRIKSREAWFDLGHQAGCRRVTDRPCNYLGYRAFLFEL